MKRIHKDKRVEVSLFSVTSFILYYFLAAFIVTCNLTMFIRVNNLNVDITNSSLGALTTFGNVIFFGLILSIFDNIRKKITIERPVKRILAAAAKVKEGDFKVRVENMRSHQKNEMDVLIEDFNTMIEALSTTETLKTDFIADVSHELKTPLAVIQNYSTMLQDPDLTEEQRIEYARSISDATKRLTNLTTNILRLNKLDNQTINAQSTEFDLSEQLCECLISFEDLWEVKNISIENNISELLIIKSDKELLENVWNNLISNAIKFTPDGGTINVTATHNKDNITVSISDTGCGMSEETMKHIFDKFYQGDTSRSTRGNGLGLTLAKRILDITGGEIKVESRLGEGSKFTVTFKA